MDQMYWDIVIMDGLCFFIFDYFITTFAERKFGWRTLAGAVIANFLLSLLLNNSYLIVGLISNLLCALGYYAIVVTGYKTGLLKGLLITIGIFLVTNFSEAIILLFCYIWDIQWIAWDNTYLRIIQRFILYGVFLLIIFTIRLVKNKKINKIGVLRNIEGVHIVFLIIVFACVYITYYFLLNGFLSGYLNGMYDFKYYEESGLWIGSVVSYILLFAATVFLLRAYIKRISRINIMSESMEKQNDQLNSLYNQYVLADALRETCINNVDNIKNAFDKGEDLTEYFKENVDSIIKYKINICNNMSVNAVIHNKQYKCREKQIELDCDVESYIETKVSDIDLCSVIFNLIDNSIEACEINKNRYVKFRMYTRKGYLVMITENYCDESNVNYKKKGDHGIGTKIIKGIADKYGGSDVIEIKNNKYIHIVTIKNQ